MAMKTDFIEADEHTYIFTEVGAKRDGDSGVGEPTARTRLVESELIRAATEAAKLLAQKLVSME